MILLPTVLNLNILIPFVTIKVITCFTTAKEILKQITSILLNLKK